MFEFVYLYNDKFLVFILSDIFRVVLNLWIFEKVFIWDFIINYIVLFLNELIFWIKIFVLIVWKIEFFIILDLDVRCYFIKW